jgi:hypothetical protein
MARNLDTRSRKVRDHFNQNSMEKGLKIPAGIYRGIVVNNEDPNKEGRVQVQIAKFYGTFKPGQVTSGNVSSEEYKGAMWCRMIIPSGGNTPPSAGPTGVVSQNTYGFLGSPPQLNNEVVVAFGEDTHSGIVLGVLPNPSTFRNALGAITGQTADGKETLAQTPSKTSDSKSDLPDEHPQAARIRAQGLEDDILRGQNNSSPTRDPSSRTSGFSSPAGHSIVLDDGSLEDSTGLGARIRTAGGAQILMDDTNGFTYIINREGNVWIEMNRLGDLDIYAAKSINYHTEGDFNVHCGGDFNLQASRNINFKSLGAVGIKLEAANGSFNMKCAANMNLQADGNGNLRIAGNYRESAARIDMNGPGALAASVPDVTQLVSNTSVTESIARRVPEAEPWSGHLDFRTSDSRGASVSTYDNVPSGDSDNQTGENDFDPSTFDGRWLRFNSNVDKKIDPALIEIVEKVAKIFGRPLVIISGHRDSAYNKLKKGAKESQHILGKAVDISSGGLSDNDRLRLVEIASRAGIRGIGVYNGGSLHFDNRTGGRAGWGSSYKYPSVPVYAKSTIDKHIAGKFTGPQRVRGV